MPQGFTPIDLLNTKQPASAVVADVEVETEVNMKVELSSTVKVAAIIRVAKQFVKTWRSAVSNSLILSNNSNEVYKGGI
ncbi:MAG: hypothetical protein PWQ10_605 [Patescibacteria group bacterium]|nr:hypothetical protein [Patescibacteria group bacterium]